VLVPARLALLRARHAACCALHIKVSAGRACWLTNERSRARHVMLTAAAAAASTAGRHERLGSLAWLIATQVCIFASAFHA
jgi:hypothetical protein